MRRLLPIVALLLSPGCVAAAERAIEKEALVKAPVEQVWNAWTTAEGVKTFFAPAAEVDARPDGAFHIFFLPDAPAGSRGADDMRFLALQPMKMITFDWSAPPSLAGARKQKTFVIVRFEPVDGATRVRLHHTGWGDGGEWDKAFDYFNRAWAVVLDRLQRRFTEGPVDWQALRAAK